MDETTRYHLILADGEEYTGVSDGAGNIILDGNFDKEDFPPDALSEVTVEENGAEPYTLVNQVLRTCYAYRSGKTMIRLSDMTDIERLEADYNAKLDYIACMTGVDLDE